MPNDAAEARRSGAPAVAVAPVVAALVVSGAAGLVHEIAWIRRAALVFGSTTHALSTVLAVFFGGLALGSAFFGRRSARAERPLVVFARLEAGIALLAVVSIPAFAAVDRLQAALWPLVEGSPVAIAVARILLVSVVLLPPSFLMGGTLPLVVAGVVREPQRIGRGVAWLYASNTAGATIGCAVAGLVLLPAIGIRATLGLGAALNLAAAALAYGTRGRSAVRGHAGEPSARATGRVLPVALLFFGGGFAALGQEVLWTRFLALVVRVRAHTTTLVLVAVLAGIALGSLLAARLADRGKPLAPAFGALHVLHGIAALALFTLPPATWRGLEGDGLRIAALVLPATLLSGAAFPLGVRMVVDDPRLAGAGVGRLAAAGTLGGIVGSLTLGFLVLPWLGLARGALVTTGASVAVGVAAWLALVGGRRSAVPALAAVVVWVLPWLSGVRVPRDFLAGPGEELVAVREGLESNLAVLRRRGVLHLEVDRTWQGQDAPSHQLLAAHLPMLLAPSARSVLVVGIGPGQAAGAFLKHPGVERLECVDIEPGVFDVARAHFGGEAWMDDPRVTQVRADGRSHLAHSREAFDVVSLELGQLYRPGVATFYTRELYEHVAARLAPGGVVGQLLPIGFLEPGDFRSAVATFLAVFPEATLWYNTSELLLVGFHGRPARIDVEAVAERLAFGAVRADLAYRHWGGDEHRLDRLENVLGCFLAGPEELASLARGAALFTDDRPVLEVRARDGSEPEASEPAILELLRPHLAVLEEHAGGGLSPAAAAAAVAQRGRNLQALAVEPLLRRATGASGESDPEALRDLYDAVLAALPEHFGARRSLADLHSAAGRLEEARAAYGAALALRPDDGPAHRGLGFALHRSGDVEGAVPHYRAALRADPGDAEAHNDLGAALAQGGDLEGALAHFETALRLRPDYGDARRNAQQARAALGR